jgi:hypothetical protein
MTLSYENIGDIFFSEKNPQKLNSIVRALGPHVSQEESLNISRQRKIKTKKFLKSCYPLSQSLDEGISYLHM